MIQIEELQGLFFRRMTGIREVLAELSRTLGGSRCFP